MTADVKEEAALVVYWRFAFQRCKVCDCRLCPAWGVFGDRPAPTPATYLMHRGFYARQSTKEGS